MASLVRAIPAYVLVRCVVLGSALVTIPQHLQADKKESEGFEVQSGFNADAAHWLDEDGQRIEAHGAGMLQSQQDGRWYWYGESYKGDTDNPGVNCYSAATLAGPWKNHGRVLSSTDISVEGWSPPFILERPKVIYNAKTGKYVMWAHLDHLEVPTPAPAPPLVAPAPPPVRPSGHIFVSRFSPRNLVARNAIPNPAPQSLAQVDATVVSDHKSKLNANQTRQTEAYSRSDVYVFRKVVVSTADSAAGPFKIDHVITPDGVASLDLNLWVDNDGTAYFIRSCDNAYTGISRLTDDYLDTTGIISTGPRVEGMALFRHTNGTLYMMTSHLTGWRPNPLVLFRSDGPSLEDPQWVDLGNPTNDPKSFNTQPTFVVQYTTKKNMTYSIYMADNWIYGGDQGLPDATYVWLPIRFADDGNVHIDRYKKWNLEAPFAEYERREFFRRLRMRRIGRITR